MRDEFKSFMEELLSRPGAKTIAPEDVYGKRKVDPDLRVDNTLVTEYRKRGRLPAFPKILTLARAYGTPIKAFYTAIGATDKEVCHCSNRIPGTGKEKDLVEQMLTITRKKDHNAQLLIDLMKVLASQKSS